MKNFFWSLFILLNLAALGLAESKDSKIFSEAKILYDNNDYVNSKILFERDLVFNPKNENSYLYLAKIFNIKKETEEEEINLNSVILLNPKNEEAIYMLANLKINQSNFEKGNELLENFKLICNLLCDKTNELEQKLKSSLPENTSNKS